LYERRRLLLFKSNVSGRAPVGRRNEETGKEMAMGKGFVLMERDNVKGQKKREGAGGGSNYKKSLCLQSEGLPSESSGRERHGRLRRKKPFSK